MRRSSTKIVALVVLSALLSGCAAGRAFRRGQEASRAGDWDAAVTYYTRAVQENPNNPEYRISLERAMQTASREHISRAREFEEHDQLDAALMSYRRAVEMDASNRLAAAKVAELERRIRDRIEATRPRPAIEKLREQARATAAPPLLDPARREPLKLTFQNASLRDVLNFIGQQSGINVTYDQQFVDRAVTVQLDDVTVEQALQQIMQAHQLFYKVLNPRTIIVVPETPAKRAQYDDLVVRVFYVSHADAMELTQTLNQVMRIPGMPVQPVVFGNKTANTVTVRGTAPVVDVIERIIRANDKPRAEVVVDVQILEVNRVRLKQFGIDLSQYAVNLLFSPEVAPPATGPPPPSNLNTISQGVSTADFYMGVPTAILRFLEQDSHSRLLAKPQLRGSEGTKLTLNLGQEIPVVTTVFGAAAAGGFATIPQSSFSYRPVGINMELTPRVTYEGEIILEISLENSALGASIDVAGQTVPSFTSRRVSTRLRLREGESNLLAGLIREDDRRAVTGVPGLLRVPIINQLFSSNRNEIDQSDIVMLLTPHIVRTHELTAEDLASMYIGTQQNVGLTGPPPLIAPHPDAEQPFAPEAVPPLPGVPDPGVPGPPVAAQPGPPVPQPDPATGAVPPGVTPTPEPATATQVIITPPGPEFRVGGGPYTVPLSVNNAQRLSMLSVTVTFNPQVLRVRTVQEGTFMRQGGVPATFTPRIDAGQGRVDIAIARNGDQAGASGSGLLAALLFDAVAPGNSMLQVSGVASAPDGSPVQLQFTPVTVTVR